MKSSSNVTECKSSFTAWVKRVRVYSSSHWGVSQSFCGLGWWWGSSYQTGLLNEEVNSMLSGNGALAGTFCFLNYELTLWTFPQAGSRQFFWLLLAASGAILSALFLLKISFSLKAVCVRQCFWIKICSQGICYWLLMSNHRGGWDYLDWPSISEPV